MQVAVSAEGLSGGQTPHWGLVVFLAPTHCLCQFREQCGQEVHKFPRLPLTQRGPRASMAGKAQARNFLDVIQEVELIQAIVACPEEHRSAARFRSEFILDTHYAASGLVLPVMSRARPVALARYG